MEKSASKQYRWLAILAGILLLVSIKPDVQNALRYIRDILDFGDYFDFKDWINYLSLILSSLLALIGSLVAAIGLFSAKKAAQNTGYLLLAGSFIISVLLNTVLSFIAFYYRPSVTHYITWALWLLPWLLLALANKNSSKGPAIAACVIVLGRFVYQLAILHVSASPSWLCNTLASALAAVYVLLTCKNTTPVKAQKAAAAAPARSQADTIEKLVSLKDLLDSGIISKEEFELKKQQLLNK